jgi:hypothetical protein
MGAGDIYRPSVDNDICKAWVAEAKEWCPQPKKRPGEKQPNFNKRLYDRLKQDNPDLYKQFDPEVPVGLKPTGTDTVTVLMKDLLAADPPDPRAVALMVNWKALAARYGGVGDPIAGKGMCSGLNSRIRGLFGKGTSGVHADGVLKDGTSVEIKAPKDKEKTNQFSNEKKCSKNGELLVIDHKACDPDGKITTPSGDCKGGS